MSTLINPFRTEESEDERRRREAEAAFDRQLAERDEYIRPTAPAAPPQDIPPPNLPEIVEDEFEFSTDPAEVEAPPVTYDDVGQGIQQAMLSPLERLRERQQTPPPAPGASIPSPSPQQSHAAPPGAGPAGANPPPGSEVQPTTNPQQAAVAGAQAAQQMAPAGPAMPQFATGGMGLGDSGPKLDMSGASDPRLRRARARSEDDRTRRRQRILQAVLGALALRSMQRGGTGGLALPALMAARMGSQPAQAEARLNADEERRQAMLQRLFENRQAVAEAQREAMDADREFALDAEIRRGQLDDSRRGTSIRAEAEERAGRMLRTDSPEAEGAREYILSVLPALPEGMRAGFTPERLARMNAAQLEDAAGRAMRFLGDEARGGGRGGASGESGGAIGPGRPGSADTPPPAFVQGVRQRLRVGFADGATREEAQRQAELEWRALGDEGRLRYTQPDPRDEQLQAGRRLQGYTAQGTIEPAQIAEARTRLIGARAVTGGLSELIYLVEHSHLGHDLAALVGADDATELNARIARLAPRVAQGIRNVDTMGALSDAEQERLARQVEALGSLGSITRSVFAGGRARSLRQFRSLIAEQADTAIRTLGFAREGERNPALVGFSPEAARRRREREMELAEQDARGETASQPTQRTPRGVRIVVRDGDRVVLRRRVPASSVDEYRRRAEARGWTFQQGGGQ